MASETTEPCLVNLHMTPLQASHGAQELARSGVELPSWIQHWAIIFLWQQKDRALRVEGMEEDDKCEVKVKEMSFQEGLDQPGTKVECGAYPLTIEQVKKVAEENGANPPDYNELTASCQTTAKEILSDLGITIGTQSALESALTFALTFLLSLGGDGAAERLQSALKETAR
ncbi:uncharacterized protein LOC119452919 isoform X2 [Dermacentor silvarum]|nr:uncharacterized protein LOC119452919 isoform X2 [Dermacentor silvarum]XP_049523348.1 uncharacterized protein LOC119452919 isoform X2 [Dermacentor silvarum]XP_049523349.1 uncharacterized protein LOC119452919 isoform X2 [Dermacentor silvarum]